jgi:hypothetical protein
MLDNPKEHIFPYVNIKLNNLVYIVMMKTLHSIWIFFFVQYIYQIVFILQ